MEKQLCEEKAYIGSGALVDIGCGSRVGRKQTLFHWLGDRKAGVVGSGGGPRARDRGRGAFCLAGSAGGGVWRVSLVEGEATDRTVR